MKKKKFVITTSIVVIAIFSLLLVARMYFFPDVDKIHYAEIYNKGTKKKLTLSEKDSKELYNLIKIKRISNRDRVKFNFRIEIKFYSENQQPLFTLYVAGENHNSSIDQVMVDYKIYRSLYIIDKHFYLNLYQIGEKNNFSFKEHLDPAEWEVN